MRCGLATLIVNISVCLKVCVGDTIFAEGQEEFLRWDEALHDAFARIVTLFTNRLSQEWHAQLCSKDWNLIRFAWDNQWKQKHVILLSVDADNYKFILCRGHGTISAGDSLRATQCGVVQQVNKLITIHCLQQRSALLYPLLAVTHADCACDSPTLVGLILRTCQRGCFCAESDCADSALCL